jgi:hypothetical protein
MVIALVATGAASNSIAALAMTSILFCISIRFDYNLCKNSFFSSNFQIIGEEKRVHDR